MKYIVDTTSEKLRIISAIEISPVLQIGLDRLSPVVIDRERKAQARKLSQLFLNNMISAYRYAAEMIKADCFILVDKLGALWYDLASLKKVIERSPDFDFCATTQERLNLLEIINHKISQQVA